MKKRSIWIALLLLVVTFCLTVGLTACDGLNKSTMTITISIEPEVEVGKSVVLEKEANFSPFLQDNIKYEFIGDNTCHAEFSHTLKNNWWTTHVSATDPGSVSIKLSYLNEEKEAVAESNVVSVTFYANEIANAEELKAIANTDKSYMLTADIDLSSEDNWAPIEGFSGFLSGGGHTISNLTINAVNSENIGLFGLLTGSVKNLKIENAQVSARGNAGKAGILAGTNEGAVSSVTVSGSIAPQYYDYVGGIVGHNNGGTIKNCVNHADVTGANYVGGIAGKMTVDQNEALASCKNEGLVTGKEAVGGIAGYITMPTSGTVTYTVSNNENNNTVTGNSNVGGVFGEVFGMANTGGWNSYYGYFEMQLLTNNAQVGGSATGENVGGIVGKATRLTSLVTCENTADISGGNCVGGIVGYAPDTDINATGSENNSTITGKGKVGGFAGHAGVIEYAVNNGEIVSTGVLIENGNSTAYVGGIAGYCQGLIFCENNADVKVETNGAYVGGLAGYISVDASETVGDNINYGAVSGADCVGGIAGYLTCSKTGTYMIASNGNRNTVTGNNNVGGIFGEVFGKIDSSGWTTYYGYFEIFVLENTAEVSGSALGSNTGGLIGKATRLNVLTTCRNAADVVGGTYVGGYVGYAPNTNINATGEENDNIITGKSYVGGFAGYAGVIEYAVNNGEIVSTAPNENGEVFLGGIAGYCTGAINCVNNADLDVSSGKYFGGIAGYIVVSESNKVNDNTNNGLLNGKENTGGIVGYLTCSGTGTYTVSGNENRNSVTGTSNVGGIVGEVFGKIDSSGWTTYYGYFEVINCVNASEITGTSCVGGIVGAHTRLKTDSNLMDTNTTLYGEKLGQ